MIITLPSPAGLSHKLQPPLLGPGHSRGRKQILCIFNLAENFWCKVVIFFFSPEITFSERTRIFIQSSWLLDQTRYVNIGGSASHPVLLRKYRRPWYKSLNNASYRQQTTFSIVSTDAAYGPQTLEADCNVCKHAIIMCTLINIRLHSRHLQCSYYRLQFHVDHATTRTNCTPVQSGAK